MSENSHGRDPSGPGSCPTGQAASHLAGKAAAIPSRRPVVRVRQNDVFGCVVACCAMVRGISYGEVVATFGSPGRGFTHDVWQRYLALNGFAVQHIYRHDPFIGRPHSPWPIKPWADLHLCSVDAGHGMGSHLVVLLRDGTVLDPATDEPRRLSDYASVAYMVAVFPVQSAPQGMEAGTAETGGLGAKPDSPVGEADAPAKSEQTDGVEA